MPTSAEPSDTTASPYLQRRPQPACAVAVDSQAASSGKVSLEPSIRSVAYGHVNQLRDPAIFQEDGRTFLLYAVAGESGIAIAELFF